MEKSPGENYLWSLFFKKKFKTLLKKNNGEILIQNGDFSILNEENSLHLFFSKKGRNAPEKHVTGEISIQNGDSSILNGENSL